MQSEFLKQAAAIQPFSLDEPMKNHTTFEVGGPADIYCEPDSLDNFAALLRLANQYHIPCLIIGAGSNLLIADSGYRGLVLKAGAAFQTLACEGSVITAGAGISMARLANFALKHSLTGLEFASGIPGLLGGAVTMNAGAYDGEMKDVITETTALDTDGNLVVFAGDEHQFRYRGSIFSNSNLVIVQSTLHLASGNLADILARMRELNRRRAEKQPLDLPSAGSTFKRPEGHFAGKLIQDAGLKGAQIGGAMVSEKHSGFVVNTGDATATDIYRLIRYIQKTVFNKFGVQLEPEVKLIGSFDPK